MGAVVRPNTSHKSLLHKINPRHSRGDNNSQRTTKTTKHNKNYRKTGNEHKDNKTP
jgi:hypothetical protein